jgi:hypothetical protein
VAVAHVELSPASALAHCALVSRVCEMVNSGPLPLMLVRKRGLDRARMDVLRSGWVRLVLLGVSAVLSSGLLVPIASVWQRLLAIG